MPALQESTAVNTPIALDARSGCRLWIDGVGCWLLWFGDSLALGNGAPTKQDQDRIRIYADLKSRHALWNRHEESTWLEPRGPARVNGQLIQEETRLRGGDRIQLGDDVELNCQVPSPLSNTATMSIVSGHRTVDGLDGWVLFDQTCLIGPGEQAHIRCRLWEETIVLFERHRHLWWRVHRGDSQPQPVRAGEILGAGDWRLRVED